MKFFEIEDCEEGRVLSYNSYLVVGKRFNWKGDHEGWYVVLNLPFVTKTIKNYIDPSTWEESPTMCFKRVFINIRRIHQPHCSRVFFHSGWSPVNILTPQTTIIE